MLCTWMKIDFRIEGQIDEIQKEYDQWQKSVRITIMLLRHEN